MSPYYIISDHCVRERALVASYFGQVIGQYFFWNTAAAAMPPLPLRHAAMLPGYPGEISGRVQCPTDDRIWPGSSEVGQPKPKSESCSTVAHSAEKESFSRASPSPKCTLVVLGNLIIPYLIHFHSH